ncbi:MAG: methyltransferase domain-containing protein, partial [Clostridia bacterium]|nr:methyltransferase domain-containing protein [Deltaproteobacteria bacterium]
MSATKQADSNTHTFFFREPEALTVVRDRARSRKRLSVWSAGCSTGDEVYSLAIRLKDFPHEVTGSDIRKDALAVAQSGLYPERCLRHTDAETVRAYFTSVGDMVRADPRLRRTMRLIEHHIINDPPLVPVRGGTWDVILCRNVLLYYEEHDMAAAIGRLASVLAPDGILILGASEWLNGALLARLPRELQLIAQLERDVVVHKHRFTKSQQNERRSGHPLMSKQAAADADVSLTADVKRLRLQGDALVDSGNAKSAIALFRAALQREPLTADLHARL